MTQAPTVSVVIPTRNREQLLRRAIQSVLGQSYTDLELIVVDDGSTDGTAALLAGVSDSRLVVVRREQGGGVSNARNLGIERARGTFIAFQDDDDIWLPTKLESQVRALQDAPVEVGVSLCAYIANHGTHAVYIGGKDALERLDFRNGPLCNSGIVATPGWLVRAEVFQKSGMFDARLRSFEDWELLFRISQHTRLSFLDDALFIQDRCEGGGLWNLYEAYAESFRIITEKHAATWRNEPAVLANYYRWTGRCEALHGDLTAAGDMLRLSIAADRWQWRSWGLFLLIKLGRPVVQRVLEVRRRIKTRGANRYGA